MTDSKSEEKLLTAGGVGALLSVSKRQVFRMRSGGLIPAPVKLGQGAIRWKMSDVLLFLDCNCDMARFRARKAAEK